jgi:hypothetical protein
MDALKHVVAIALACVWIGAGASAQFVPPDWSGFPGPATSSAGDVNGDGFDDAILGGYGLANPDEFEGRARIYLGSPTGLGENAVWEVEGNQEGAYFGWKVAGVGDVNGDGFDDVLVAAPYFDAPYFGDVFEDAGRACLYLGSPTGPSTTPSWIQDGQGFTWYLGWDIAAAGDVNGDGFDDVIIGLPGAGTAAVWHGNASGVLDFAWQGFDTDLMDGYGNRVTGAGDVNGDGFDDVIVSAPLRSEPEIWEGKVFGYLGSSSGLSVTPFWMDETNVQDDFYGIELASAGDMNDDGFGDFAVSSANGVKVFQGGPVSVTLAWSEAAGNDDSFGWALAAGDLNDDGFDDLMVTAPTPHGRVDVFEGSSAGLSGPTWTSAAFSFDRFGMGLGAGDFDGDGHCDILVTDEPDEDGNGSAYAYYGWRFQPHGPKKQRAHWVPKPRSH